MSVFKVICILPSNRKDRYDAIKKYCCVECPGMSLCVCSHVCVSQCVLLCVCVCLCVTIIANIYVSAQSSGGGSYID